MPEKPFSPNSPGFLTSTLEMTVDTQGEVFHLFLEYMPVAVAMVDCQFRYIAVSRPWQELWGKETKLVGHLLSENLPHLSESWYKNAGSCLMESGERREFMEILWKDSSSPIPVIQSIKWVFHPWKNSLNSLGGLIIYSQLEQQPLNESLQLAELVLEKATDGVLWIKKDGSLSYVNESICRVLGYDRSTLLNLTIYDLNQDLSREEWSQHWQILQEKGSLRFESLYQTQSGIPFSVELTVNYLEFNEQEYYCAFVHDISERKRGQLALIEAKEQLEAVLNAVPGFVSWVGADLHYLGVNQHLANAYNIPPEEFVGKEVGFLKTSPQFNELVCDFLRSKKWTISKAITTTVKQKSCTYLIAAQKYNKGQAAVFVGLDITEREQIEIALRLSEEKYRTLTQNFPNGAVILFDFDYRYTLAEGTELAKMGLSKEMMEGKVLWEVFSTEISQKIQGYYQEALGGISQVWEMEYEDNIYLCYTLPLRNQSTEVWAGMMMIQNITEEKRALFALQNSEEQLRQQTTELEQTLWELKRTQTQLIQREKMSALGQLVAGVAHEINNPVSFISGNLTHASNYIRDLLELVDLYQKNCPNPSEEIEEELEEIGLEFLRKDLPKLLDSMKVGADRIREVVRSLRLFSRTDESEMKLVDIHEGLESTLLILQNRLQAKGGRRGISLQKKYGNLPKIQCYASQLNQVFMHLLSYAIDDLEESMNKEEMLLEEFTLSIQTEVESEQVVIRIEDNGEGLPEEIRKNIFEPPLFVTESGGKTMGLGLSISYHLIVEKEKGELECFSELGKGTTFVIKIPLNRSFIPGKMCYI